MSWLHISDFHFVASGDQFSQDVATRALLEDASSHSVGVLPISFVLLTGDVAFSGQPEEYDRAEAFLSQFADALHLPPERFFFVPGNHDVDRSKHTLALKGAFQELTSQEAVDQVLARPDDIRDLIERQAAFWAFVTRFTKGQERMLTDDGLAYVAPINLGGIRVCILGLNSAWLSGGDGEEMKLLIGERQVINTLWLAESINPYLKIAMAHHPISWLREWDQVSCNLRLLREVDLYQRGHLHQGEVALASSPDSPCLSVAAGSGHATRHYGNSYNLLDLDLGLGKCVVRSFQYDPSSGQYRYAGEVTGPISLRGSLPGGPAELATVLAVRVPAAEPYAGYLAALVTGHQVEIPVRIEEGVEFVTQEVATELAPPAELTDTTAFLKLRNLLRLYDESVPLSTRVAQHAAVVQDFARRLQTLAGDDTMFAQQLNARHQSALRVAARSTQTRRPHAKAFLKDLRLRGEWPVLERQARRYVTSPDPDVARTATVALIEALMHSDEGEKRQEAALLAKRLVDDPDAPVDDYLLAAASAELIRDDKVSAEIAQRALAKWPGDPALQSYARGLALRSGDIELRRVVDAALKGGRSPHE